MGVKVREKVAGSGEWWIFINHRGQRRSKKIGRDHKKALEIAKQVSAKITLKEFNIDSDEPINAPIFKDYAATYLKTYAKLHLKPSTIDSYDSVLRNHLIPIFGNCRLDEIKRKDIKRFVIAKQNAGCSPNTVRIMRAYLSAIMNQAVDDEILEVNPASNTGRYIKRMHNGADVSPFTWEEKAAFEKAMFERFPWYHPFFICALRTGMREGELIALRPGDVDFRGGFIEVRRNAVRGMIDTPKSGKSRRVEMTPQLGEVLTEHLTKTKRLTLQKGWKTVPEWLFYNEEGGMIDVSNLRKRVFYKCLEKAKLRQIRLHDLRHTYATLRIQAGHNIADVSRQLGHSSIRITVDTYYHWIPGTNSGEVHELDLQSAPKRTLSAPSHETTKKKGTANDR